MEGLSRHRAVAGSMVKEWRTARFKQVGSPCASLGRWMTFLGEEVLLVCECHYDVHTHQEIHGVLDAAKMTLFVLY